MIHLLESRKNQKDLLIFDEKSEATYIEWKRSKDLGFCSFDLNSFSDYVRLQFKFHEVTIWELANSFIRSMS